MRKKIRLYTWTLVLPLLLGACGQEQQKETLPEKVSFTEHIAPLLYQHCTNCHHPGGAAHFNLVTYEDARNYGPSMAYSMRQRLMPPWPADPHYTQFIGQRVLSEQEIQIMEKWVKQGMVQGPPGKMPSLPEYPAGSMIGVPDLRLAVAPHYMKAGSGDEFLLVKVPFELPQDTFASAIEFVAGNNNMVHHVNGDMIRYDYDKKKDVFAGESVVDMKEDSTIRQAYERLMLPNDDGTYPMLKKSVVNYLPGVFEIKYSKEIGGFVLPRKGAFLLNDIHYGFAKKDGWDSSYINIFFSRTPPERPLQEFQLGTLGIAPVVPDLVIEPNTVKKVYSRYVVPSDISIVSVNPHMHLLGKSFKGYALTPQGDTIRLISIPRWDFNWQYFYRYRHPVRIPKGSTLVAEGVYDNTNNNPFNPFNPPQQVRDRNGSMRATDEMFQFIVTYVPYKEGDEKLDLEPK